MAAEKNLTAEEGYAVLEAAGIRVWRKQDHVRVYDPRRKGAWLYLEECRYTGDDGREIVYCRPRDGGTSETKMQKPSGALHAQVRAALAAATKIA